MCERIAQYRLKQEYAEAIGWSAGPFDDKVGDRIANWNVPPGSQPWLMHRLRNRRPNIEMLNWGYRPEWAAEAGIPMAASVRLDQATIGPYFKPLFKSGRAVVPVDGWYEWTKTADVRQPWFIQSKNREPLFLAAIACFRPHNLSADGTGFVLVCDTDNGGLVDASELRPIVLSADAAMLWMDPDVQADDAANAAHACTLNPDDFEWFRVTLNVNRYASNGSELIVPLAIREHA